MRPWKILVVRAQYFDGDKMPANRNARISGRGHAIYRTYLRLCELRGMVSGTVLRILQHPANRARGSSGCLPRECEWRKRQVMSVADDSSWFLKQQ